MKNELTLFDDKPHEYFFLISPDQKTREEVKLRKEKVNSLINLSKENLWSVPHLSLCKWSVDHSIDEIIISKITEALKGVKRFKIKLDGLEVYSHGTIKKSLVLKIKYPDPIRFINRSLINEFNFRPRKILPHITIARAIPVSDFNKLSNVLNEFDYKGEFLCNKITILKKIIGEYQRYMLFHEALLN